MLSQCHRQLQVTAIQGGPDHASPVEGRRIDRLVARTRGGLGQVIEIESRIGRPFELLAAFDRIDHPARGVEGGGDGAAGAVSLASGATLKGKGFQTIPPGDRLVVLTPGGGGIGPAAERAEDALARDLAEGYVTAKP